jgi:hypothetical protein
MFALIAYFGGAAILRWQMDVRDGIDRLQRVEDFPGVANQPETKDKSSASSDISADDAIRVAMKHLGIAKESLPEYEVTPSMALSSYSSRSAAPSSRFL